MKTGSDIAPLRPLLAALLAVTLISACKDGNDGAPGGPGPDTPPPAQEITDISMNLEQWAITDEGMIQFRILVTNQNGEGVAGLPSATLLAAQLLPSGFTGAGNSTEWRFLGSETCTAGGECPGQWTDYANGFYDYQSGLNVNNAEGVTYSPDATQRLVVKIGGDALPDGTDLPVVNAFVDFAPNGGDPAYTRLIAGTESCESCHTDIAGIRHGGRYTELETCTTCHSENRISNPENVLSGLAHSAHGESGLANFVNCETCHSGGDALPQSDNWALFPSQLACGSCHSAIDFEAGIGHPAQADNSNCVACHNPDWTRSAHLMTDKADALAQFDASVDSITPDLAAGTLSIVVTLTNPQTGEALASPDQLPYLNDLRLYANWGTSFDYSIRSAPNIRLESLTPEETVVPGQYRYTLPGLTVPPGTDMDEGGAVALQGRLCRNGSALVSCDDASASTVQVPSHTTFFAVGSGMARRNVVSNETCGTCHGDQQLNFHGARNDLTQQCQLCHNAQMVASASAPNVSASNANYSHMIHAIHTAQREGYEDLAYPAPVSDCRQCHISDAGSDSFALPILATVPPMALDDGTFTSAEAATCSVCHSGSGAQAHMTQQGAVFGGTLEMASGDKGCAFCHGAGSAYDIAPAHGLAPAQ
ncbi:OmcA/MtrC family decaheme c-type cytochrome [Marinobacter hydrocarbonoclasticus]|nr:OmcA/MtrC family decaheme c-type cytochrome [Marinobacter nauticus]